MKYKLRIHCWGGLGSQLYAVALIYDLLKRFPKRKITLYLHTSGATRRHSEIEGIADIFEIKQVDDFKTSDESVFSYGNMFQKKIGRAHV